MRFLDLLVHGDVQTPQWFAAIFHIVPSIQRSLMMMKTHFDDDLSIRKAGVVTLVICAPPKSVRMQISSLLQMIAERVEGGFERTKIIASFEIEGPKHRACV